MSFPAWRLFRPACLAIVLFARAAKADGFDEALVHCQRGAYSAAVAVAKTVDDPIRRAQALVWTHQEAGDWVGADRIAQEALQAHPGDSWLAERRVNYAVTLGRSDLLPQRLEQWEQALSLEGPASEQRAAGLARLAAMREQSEELVQARGARGAAITRAKGVTLGGALLLAALAAWAARPLRKS